MPSMWHVLAFVWRQLHLLSYAIHVARTCVCMEAASSPVLCHPCGTYLRLYGGSFISCPMLSMWHVLAFVWRQLHLLSYAIHVARTCLCMEAASSPVLCYPCGTYLPLYGGSFISCPM